MVEETNQDLITGKVASVSSDRELIINRGSDHGVEVGMVFRVKGAPTEVRDPDSGEVIGTVSKAKVLVKVSDVDEGISIARTFRTRSVNVGGKGLGGDVYGSLFGAPKFETRVETLRRSPNAGTPIDPADSIVEVGDLVEQTTEEEPIGSSTVWR